MKRASIWLVCGLITVAIGVANIWVGILAVPIMYSVAQSLTE